MNFCRINLSKTNYQLMDTARIFDQNQRAVNYKQIQEIYQSYCKYKQFKSVMPLFPSVINDYNNDLIGYYDNNTLVAWSIIKRYDQHNVESLQFAWTYTNPDLYLGIKSIEHECAFYKQKGHHYLYLGLTAKYKSKIDGYEVLSSYVSEI